MGARGADGGRLTHSQTQIWVGQTLHPESPLYNMAFAFTFPTELRADPFREAWQRVVDANDVLRTRYELRDGAAVASVAEPGSCPTEILDFGQRADPEMEFRDLARSRCATPFPIGGNLVEIRQEITSREQGKGENLRASQGGAHSVRRITGIGHQRQVTGIETSQSQVDDALFGTDEGHDLGFGV